MIPLPISEVNWKPCFRIIPSRFPPVDLFKDIAPSEDWMALAEIETLTNERVREERGEVPYVRAEDQLRGPGTSLIMAPFTHPDPIGDHFTDGTFGVCYTTSSFEDALAASVRRREDFLSSTHQGPIDLQMRVLNMDLEGRFHDLRGEIATEFGERSSAQALGRELREQGSFGFIYGSPLSVRGATVAVLRPTVLSNCRQERHLAYRWNGTRIAGVFDYSTGQTIPI